MFVTKRASFANCMQVALFEDSNLCAIHAKRVTILHIMSIA